MALPSDAYPEVPREILRQPRRNKLDRQKKREIIADIIDGYCWTVKGKSTYDLADEFLDALKPGMKRL